jgi:hypothetical protein
LFDDVKWTVRFMEVAPGGILGFGDSKSFIPVDAITRMTRRRTIGVEPRRSIVAEETLVSLLSWIKRTLTGAPDASAAEPPPRHERREAGRERHRETGEPAWEESDRLDDPPGTGNRNPDAAPEILGDV